MRRYLLKILIFFSIAGIIDIVFGYYCRSMQPKAMYGNNHDIYHIANNANEDIIMMGSSRCHHHFVPSIISDTMKMSCYNAGCDGNGIIYQYGLLQLMLRSHKPKIIIYDFFPEYDISNNDNIKYINNLKPYAHEECLRELFNDINYYEKYKTISSFYVFNSNFVQLYKDTRKPLVKTYNGYLPSSDVMDYEPKETTSTYTIDTLKLEYFRKFISVCKSNNIRLIMTFSPFYKSVKWQNLDFLYDFCKSNNLVLLDYYTKDYLNKRKELYKDQTHLNDSGAHVFSSRFASDLTRILNDKNESFAD